ncbi:putative methyltransferase-domain-containing protein [Chytriomyces cf. hyalinus JEL632]|nr:putative methyltransferase-domain-containing protein [Chytriomyces cf. hyalinus JEL632]
MAYNSDSDNDDIFQAQSRLDTGNVLVQEQEQSRIGTEQIFAFDRYKSRTIKIAEDTSGGCGGKTWEAATVLSNHLVHRWHENHNFLQGLNVVELGAGTGVVGILAAMLMKDSRDENIDSANPTSVKPGKVFITDMLFLDLMQTNVDLNLTESERECAKVVELKWGEPSPAEVLSEPVHIILASDCVYLEAAFEPLLETLAELSTEGVTEILIVSKKRRKADKRFFDKLKKKFDVVEVKDDPDYPVYSRQSLAILSARIKKGGGRKTE